MTMSAVMMIMSLLSCATTRTPLLRVERLEIDKLKISGLAMHVDFMAVNPNPEDLPVEHFEYELWLNGMRLGRGVHREPLLMRAYEERRIRSRFQLNLLALPIGVRRVLDSEYVNAHVKGVFFVDNRRGGLKGLGFTSSAHVELSH
jgi:LEA14-like dessication related protein